MVRCEGHVKNWNQCNRKATRVIRELPIPTGGRPDFNYCDRHADESLAGGLAKEVNP